MSAFDNETSGSTSFNLTAHQIIQEAFDVLQMGVEGEELNDGMTNRGLRSLNLLLHTWQAEGVHIATYEDGTLWTSKGKAKYEIENENSTNAYQQYNLAQDAAETDTSIFIDPDTFVDFYQEGPIALDWYCGVTLDDNELFWTRVDAFDSGTNEVTLRDALTGDAASGRKVFLYENTLKPIHRILDMRRATNYINDIPMEFISRQEYFALPEKTFTGVPVEGYFERRQSKGNLFLWPVPESSTTPIKFTYERLIEDMINPDDSLDMEQYYLEACVYSLAKRLALKFRVPRDVKQWVNDMADETWVKAQEMDTEVYDIGISLNRESR